MRARHRPGQAPQATERRGRRRGRGRAPPQAFERWRFAAKHAEETDPGVTVPADARDPSVPSVVDADDGAPVAQLESDLARAGVPAGDAARVAREIATSAAAEALALRKLRDRLRGAPAADAAPVTVAVTFRKHSVELVSSKGGHFVVLSRVAYGKLAAMYRRNAPPGDPELPPLANDPANGNGSDGSDGSDADDSDGDDSDGDGDGDGAAREGPSRRRSRAPPPSPESASRTAFHARLFALLLRYKSIQGYGFQASVGPGAFETLRDAIGAGTECFASPLNAFLRAFLLGVSRRGRALRLLRRFLRRRDATQARVLPGQPAVRGPRHVRDGARDARRARRRRTRRSTAHVRRLRTRVDGRTLVGFAVGESARSVEVRRRRGGPRGTATAPRIREKRRSAGRRTTRGCSCCSRRARRRAAGRRALLDRPSRAVCRDSRRKFERRSRGRGSRRASSPPHVGDAAAGGRKKRKKKESREGGDEEGDEGRKKKKEKKKESKAAKKRRKRREGKTDAAKVADGGEANE